MPGTLLAAEGAEVNKKYDEPTLRSVHCKISDKTIW